MPAPKLVLPPRFVPDEREAPTQQMTIVPDSGVESSTPSSIPVEAMRSGIRPAFTDDELERIERRERLDTLPAPPDDQN